MAYKSKIPDVINGMEQRADMITEVTARQIEGGAIVRSREDSGLMKGAWSVRVEGLARRLVYNPIIYSIYNERGTRRMSAQPMLTPSVEEAWPGFKKAAATVLTLKGRAKLGVRGWLGR